MKRFYTPFAISKHPPKISSKAMKKKENPKRASKIGSFLAGVGSVVDVCPPQSRKIFYTRDDFQSRSSELEGMSADLESVGDSFKSVGDSFRAVIDGDDD